MPLKKYIFTSRHQLVVLLLLAVGLNINTLFNSYALDDAAVLTENNYVQKGLKGIPEILSSELFKGLKDKGAFSNLTEVRYRPLALVLFAVEYQFFGANPMVSHLINVILFALLIVLLYELLHKHLFRKGNTLFPFVVCLLFVVHPIHTEVVANVKSRDEIITFIFLLVSLTSFIKYSEARRTLHLIAGLFCFFLALLTRETAVTFIAVLPLVLYFFANRNLKQAILFSILLLVVFGVYMLMRIKIVGFSYSSATDVLHSPFLLATHSEAFATKVYILYRYLQLLIFPHPLSFEYGYNQIPYLQLASVKFIFSMILMVALSAFAFISFKKKPLFSFSIIYFFVTISVGSNFIIDLGTPMAERMLFQPSLAFCMAASAVYMEIDKRSKLFSNGIFIVILFLFSCKTYLRNQVWKNNETLVLTDIVSSPNSVYMNYAATELYLLKANNEQDVQLKNTYFNNAVVYGKQTLSIYPGFAVAYMNLGSAYYGLQDYFQAGDCWMHAFGLMPNEPRAKYFVEFLSDVLYKKGNGFSEQGNIDQAIQYYKRSTEMNSRNVEAWYNLGGNYLLKNDSAAARESWNKVIDMEPTHPLKKEDFIRR